MLYQVFDMDGINFKVLGSTMSSIFESSLFPPRSYCDANTLIFGNLIELSKCVSSPKAESSIMTFLRLSSPMKSKLPVGML